jgi:serine/threonine protein phosphatase PrpC
LATCEWGVLGKSIRGPNHKISGLPNQDSIRIYSGGNGKATIIAIADGHGSSIHFRSAIGSRIAVDCAVHILSNKFKKLDTLEIKRCMDDIPNLVCNAWNDKIIHHYAQNKFLPNELALFEDNCWSNDFLEQLKLNARIAYGTTLLVVVIKDSLILYMQIGDGDILVVDESGETRKPLTDDIQYSKYQTKSLCADNAKLDFRVTTEDINYSNPVLVTTSTDGYSNSFMNYLDFTKTASRYLDMLRVIGPQLLQKIMRNLLLRTTSCGSGDDISMAMAYRADKIGKIGQLFPQN